MNAPPLRQPCAVIVSPGLWGRRFEVAVEPPNLHHPMRTFHTRTDALAYAAELARVEGWRLIYRTVGDG